MSRDISPSKEALSNRNLTLLLDTLSKKETQKSLEALSKIDKDEWRAMATTATMLNSFVALGGTRELLSSIKNTIDLKMEEFLAPLQNEINQNIADLINPLIEFITPTINDLASFLAENAVGAGVGGIAGVITSKFLPGGSIWLVLGSLFGSLLESELTKFFEGEKSAFSDAENFWPVIEILWERFWNFVFSGSFGGSGSSSTPYIPRPQKRGGGPQEDF